MSPAISVLMPCYNAADTLEEALDSLQEQTLTDIEVIAVDDGSDDHTAEILAEWAARDNRFRIYHQEHAGIVSALNTGLARCTAPLVARMDVDDRAYPTRLARQAAFLELHPDVEVVGSLVRGTPETEVREGFRIYIDWLNGLVTDAQIRREIFVESPLVHPSVLFRKEAVDRVGGYRDFGWPEDYDLWLRLYLAGARFGKVPEILLDWREHPERLTRTDSRYSLENFIRLKAHYLAAGPLATRKMVFVWGAGMMGRRLSKHLLRAGVSIQAFIDVDPRKIGRTLRQRPILAPGQLPEAWAAAQMPALLAAVGARGARPLIRQSLADLGLEEGLDWWCAA